jgi:hypothetical protein
MDWSAGCLVDLDAAPGDRIGRHGPANTTTLTVVNDH